MLGVEVGALANARGVPETMSARMKVVMIVAVNLVCVFIIDYIGVSFL